MQEGFIFYFCPLPCFLCSRPWSSCSSSATDYFWYHIDLYLQLTACKRYLDFFFLMKVKRYLMMLFTVRHRWNLCSKSWAVFKHTVTGSCYFFDSLGQFIPFKLTLHQQVLGFSAVTEAASSDDDICKWNLACCELLGWKVTARHLNPMLSRTVMMFWEWICNKFLICLNFRGTALLQLPESHHEACLVTLYRIHISPCMAYRICDLNLFVLIYSHF